MSPKPSKRLKIRRLVIAGVMTVLLVVALRPMFNGVSPMSPWMMALHQLGLSYRTLDEFYRVHNQWPETYSDMVDFANKHGTLFYPFKDPLDGTEREWLLLTNLVQDTSVDTQKLILLAAPVTGGYRPEHADMRLVLFDRGRANWIIEEDFQKVLKNNRQH
jgi:hypothetical protein